MNVPVLTISSRRPHEPYYYLDAFERSCAKQGIAPIFLPGTPWGGLMTKLRRLQEWLETKGMGYSIVIFCDSWDIIFVNSVGSIVHKFEAQKVPLMFNAERSCFPRGDLADKFPETGTPYRYLNSGFMVGYTVAILDMLRDLNLPSIPDDHTQPDGKRFEPNDQGYIAQWFVDHPGRAALDTSATICQSLHGSGDDEFEFLNGRVVSKLTGNTPSAFHGNGGGKVWLRKIMEWLNI
jgi:hypothetical protein